LMKSFKSFIMKEEDGNLIKNISIINTCIFYLHLLLKQYGL
jgi:hypothetical protein